MSYNLTKDAAKISTITNTLPSTNDYLKGDGTNFTANSSITPECPLMYYFIGNGGGSGTAYSYGSTDTRLTWRSTGGYDGIAPDGNNFSDSNSAPSSHDEFFTHSSVDYLGREAAYSPSTSTNNWHSGITLKQGTYLLLGRVTAHQNSSSDGMICAWYDTDDNRVGPHSYMQEYGVGGRNHDFAIAVVDVPLAGKTYVLKLVQELGTINIHMNTNDVKRTVVAVERL